LRAADGLNVLIEGERIVLTPKKKRSRRERNIKDPITGLPVLTAPPSPGAPKLTSKQVSEMLADFP